jgi:hypothetical protein
MATDEQIKEMRVDYWMAMICLKRKTELDPLVGDPADFGIDGEPCPERLMRRWRAALFATREELDEAIKATMDDAVSRGHEWVKRFVFQPVRCRIVQKGGE